MRLLDWNIRKINATSSRSLRRVLEAIDEVDPDALALQEVGDGVRDRLVAALESRGHVAVTSDVPTRLKGHRVLVAARRSLVGNSPRVFVHPTFPRAIVGIEIPLTALVGKWKMSQNRPPADRAGVIRGLQERAAPGDENIAAQVAASVPDPQKR